MNSLRIFNFLLVMALVGMAGCAAQWPGKDPGGSTHQPPYGDEPDDLGLEDIVFKFNSSGNLMPVTVDGKPYEVCFEQGRRACRFYQDEVKISKLKTTTILQIQYDVNPENCRYIKIIENGIETNLIHPADRKKDC